ncbi:kinesin-like protein [Trichoderma parareesei]|uniref:Kinesin-like protein n=1 Tax=Trichoderma parareesei TaxID=858221 RepID=A0A2H2ZFT2_TRIPA|nr:kinesin-like protein [Trichoderma parareesei]
MGPSDTSLPTLSVPKSRKSMASIPSPKSPAAPRSGLRAPSTASPASSNSSIPPIPKAGQLAAASSKTVRKAVSINSFPKPPKGDGRNSSMPSSPLAGNGARATRKPKPVRDSVASSNTPTPTPSLLNGSAEGKFISSVPQGSYSTSATTYEDSADASGSASEKRSSATEAKGNVIVSVRVRPDSSNSDHADGEWMVDGRRALIGYRGKEGGDYYYDNVFTTHDDNARVYDHMAKRLVRRVMEGYHGTVFAYGQTGTGKTFSMQGTASSPGVIPLAITDIFSYIRETPSREFLLRVSYLEIYNEKIHDLLSMASANGAAAPQEEIKLREDAKRGVYATPLKEEIVQSPTQLLRVIARGDQARRTASTQFNSRSSRSHAVVQIIVESRERMPASGNAGDSKRSGMVPGGVRVSTLSLIDLAGSEKAAESKERRQEGAHINKSLLTLGTVIAKLSEWKDKGGDKDGKHLPYRDSKLTRLLQGALSGNSLVSILCTAALGVTGTAATSANHTIETLNTLKFASRAKNSIVSHAKKAEEALGAGGDGGARVLLERYRMEIQELKQQLESQANKKNDEEIKELVEEDRVQTQQMAERHEEQILEMQLARTALKERIDHLNRLILSSKSAGVNSNGTMSALARYSQISLVPGSARSSVAMSIRSPLERTASVASNSTIGRRSSYGAKRMSGEAATEIIDAEEDSIGENGDGLASLTAQNRALQADLADKNRYISTLEKRLLQARRASSSRTSSGFSVTTKGIMVGEDHSVAALLKEKDAEIADLRARLDDKDRMLAALRSAARSRDNADAMTEPRSPQSQDGIRNSLHWSPLRKESKRRTKSIDEMNNMLEEMIQDRVETGQIVRGVRGSVRLAPIHRLESLGEPPSELPPLRRVATPVGERSTPVEAAS